MKPLISAILFIVACTSFATAHDLPKGVTIKVADTGDVVIVLEKGAAVFVAQRGKDGQRIIVGNHEGTLSTLQLIEGGNTPVDVKYLSDQKAEVTITRRNDPDLPLPLIQDSDGDGIPDLKIDRTGKYRVKKIEWEKVEEKQDGQNKAREDKR